MDTKQVVPDGLKVKLTYGSTYGRVGEIIVLSYSVAKEEIRAGRAIEVKQ